MNPNLSFGKGGVPMWKGYTLAHYTPENPALGWAPDKGYKYQSKEHSAQMYAELKEALNAVQEYYDAGR